MIELISDNVNLIPSILAIVGGLYAFIKWLDERRLRLEDRKLAFKDERLKGYQSLLMTLSGSTTGGLLEQVASAWQILEYQEYDEMTLRIFRNRELLETAPDAWKKTVLPELNEVLKVIKQRHENKC